MHELPRPEQSSNFAGSREWNVRVPRLQSSLPLRSLERRLNGAVPRRPSIPCCGIPGCSRRSPASRCIHRGRLRERRGLPHRLWRCHGLPHQRRRRDLCCQCGRRYHQYSSHRGFDRRRGRPWTPVRSGRRCQQHSSRHGPGRRCGRPWTPVRSGHPHRPPVRHIGSRSPGWGKACRRDERHCAASCRRLPRRCVRSCCCC